MKRKLLFILFLSIQASAQNSKFFKAKISGSCSDEFINNYKGKGLIHEPFSVTDYHDDVMKRLNALQDLIHQTYRNPWPLT